MRRLLSVSFFRSLASLVAAAYLLINPGILPAVAAPATQQQVNDFLSDTSALLKANLLGGGKLVSAIRDLMMSDVCQPSTVQARVESCQQLLTAVIGLLANANEAQQSAIGSGLGQAAQSMASTNPVLAAQLQAALAASGSKMAVASYQTTVGNLPIASTGGGGGGEASYQTEQNTGGGAGGGGATGPTGTGTQSVGLTSGGSVSGGTSTTTAATTPVSP